VVRRRPPPARSGWAWSGCPVRYQNLHYQNRGRLRFQKFQAHCQSSSPTRVHCGHSGHGGCTLHPVSSKRLSQRLVPRCDGDILGARMSRGHPAGHRGCPAGCPAGCPRDNVARRNLAFLNRKSFEPIQERSSTVSP